MNVISFDNAVELWYIYSVIRTDGTYCFYRGGTMNTTDYDDGYSDGYQNGYAMGMRKMVQQIIVRSVMAYIHDGQFISYVCNDIAHLEDVMMHWVMDRKEVFYEVTLGTMHDVKMDLIQELGIIDK